LADELGADAIGVQCDVADPESVSAAMDAVIARFGRVDTLVNNAGVHRGGKVKRLADDAWQEVLQVNLTGAMNMARAALAHMEEGGAIINVGAVVGFRGFPGDAAYASSKAGLSGLTKALAIELAPKAITANLVIPGLVLTEMTSGLTEASLEAMNKQIPMRRFAEEREIAEVVYWVSQSRYMTGACVPVDGGLLSSFGVT
jgi:3-oxoacyl-[acyl-carrier protein] reductase